MRIVWKKAGLRAGAILLWILIWKAAAVSLGKELLLPAPETVIRRIFELMVTSHFWMTIGVSLTRVFAGIAAAILLGVLLAAMTSFSRVAEILLEPVFTIIKATPVASFTILILLWIDRTWVPVLISALMVFPVIWANVSEGIRKTDRGLLEMAKVYHLSKTRVLMRIYVPSVRPFFLSACRSVLGFGWKAGIAAEVLTVPGRSIGKMIYESKLYLQTPDLFAWTISVILLSVLLEKAVLHLFGGKQ